MVRAFAFQFASLVCLAGSSLADCGTALMLSMDVSNSIDSIEFRLQADGLADALADPEIAEILVRDQVALAVMQWSGEGKQALSIDWQIMEDPAQVRAFATASRAMRRAFILSDTAPAPALEFALDQFARAPECGRRVIDVSGDGTPNAGGGVGPARQRAERMGVTINGLAIEALGQAVAVTNFYRRNLVTRDGFVLTSRGHRAYPETIRRKLLRELARVLG